MSTGAGPIAGYTCVARQEYAGLEIASMNLDSLQLCVDACKSRTDCTFIVYSNDRMCSLRSDFLNGPDGSNRHSQWLLQSCIKDETGAANSSRGVLLLYLVRIVTTNSRNQSSNKGFISQPASD